MSPQNNKVSISRKRKLVFAVVAVVLSLATMTGALVAAEVYSRSRFARSDGLNVEGYRGRVLGRKQSGELRVALSGGSTAFGFGILPDEAPSARLEQKLVRRRHDSGQSPVSVANLAYTSEGAFAAKFTLADYSYLDLDVVVFHDGYNDVAGENRRIFRHESPVFRLTGYVPLLPTVIQEKVLLLRYGSLEAAYGGAKPVFRPTIAQRTTAAALSAADQVGQSLGTQVGRLLGPSRPPVSNSVAVDEQARCAEPWRVFCQTVVDNVEYALQRGMRVLVVGQPIWADPTFQKRHQEQQAQMVAMVQARYGSNPAVRLVDLRDAIDLSDQTLAYDRMHLTPAGSERLASLLVDPVMAILNDLTQKGP